MESKQTIMKYKVGDKLVASDFDKQQYGLQHVTITSINEDKQVYHWEAEWCGGKIHSGYFFKEVDDRMDFICPDPDCPHCNYEE